MFSTDRPQQISTSRLRGDGFGISPSELTLGAIHRDHQTRLPTLLSARKVRVDFRMV